MGQSQGLRLGILPMTNSCAPPTNRLAFPPASADPPAHPPVELDPVSALVVPPVGGQRKDKVFLALTTAKQESLSRSVLAGATLGQRGPRNSLQSASYWSPKPSFHYSIMDVIITNLKASTRNNESTSCRAIVKLDLARLIICPSEGMNRLGLLSRTDVQSHAMQVDVGKTESQVAQCA
jgi:hypothetical protein